MRNLEELSGHDPDTADGVIVYLSESLGKMKAIAVVPGSVSTSALSRFHRAMVAYLEGKHCLFNIRLETHPCMQAYVLLETSEFDFEKRFGWFVECLRQSRVIKNPIISNMTSCGIKIKDHK